MIKPQITLFRDFIEDGRTSMEIYADGLGKALRLNSEDNFQIKDFTPHTSNFITKTLGINHSQMRIERYLHYPLQARKQQGSVNHIIDHAYGHLLRFINPQTSIVTVHDMIPVLAYMKKIPGLTYPHLPALFKFSLSSLSRARFIVAVSNSTKKDLITYCGLEDEKVKVIYNGIGDIFTPFSSRKKEVLRKSFGFPDMGTHIVLITGSLGYKNHAASFKVIEILQLRTIKPIQLVILKSAANDLNIDEAEYSFNNPIIILSGIDNNRLVELYNAVDCLLFPSLYEGFGWPPLESMACGTPVVTSDIGPFPEIVGDAGLMQSPYEPFKLAEAVLLLLENQEVRRLYIERGLKKAKEFTWERCANEFGKLYDDILEMK